MSKTIERQTSGLQLSKSSSPEILKTYFKKIFELEQSGKEFPVNLDDVWPLVYGRKEEAVRVLKSDFAKDEDYTTQISDRQFLRKNAEQKYGQGRNRIDYYLSIPCLEYFVAKKVKPVFEVYRRVFHAKVNDGCPLIQSVNNMACYVYIDYLRWCGLSIRSGSVYRRMRNNPQEFVCVDGVYYVSQVYGKVIKRNAELRMSYKMLRERKEVYLDRQLKLEFQLKELVDANMIINKDERMKRVDEIIGGS